MIIHKNILMWVYDKVIQDLILRYNKLSELNQILAEKYINILAHMSCFH